MNFRKRRQGYVQNIPTFTRIKFEEEETIWFLQNLAWIWAESSESEFWNLYAAVLSLLNTSSALIFLIRSLQHPWIKLGQPFSLSKTSRTLRTRKRKKERRKERKRRKNGKANCWIRLQTAEDVQKRWLDLTKSQDSRRSVCCLISQSARADGMLRPSDFVEFPPVSTLLTRIFSEVLPMISNFILKVHNFQLPTKRQSPRLQTHYGSKRHPRTPNFNC